MPSTTSFKNLSHRARGESNLGGVVLFLVFSTLDLTRDWPAAEDITDGKVTTPPPLKTGKVPATITPDLDSGSFKHSRKGALGYQVHSVEGGAKHAGISTEQYAAAEATFNTGGMVIAQDMEGKRFILGNRTRPLNFEYDSQTGAKVGDDKQIDLKFKGEGYAHAPYELEESVVIPLALD